MMENAAITLGDSLAPVPWYLRVNLGTEDTSVLEHLRQRKELRVLEICFKEHIISSVACVGTEVPPKILKTSGYIIQYSMTV